MPRKENPGPISAQAQQDLVSEGIENYELPKSVVMKIARSALPDEARLTKETILSLVKGSTVFINYIAATAHDVAISKQHKTIGAADVLKALELCDFGDLVEGLEKEVKVFKANGGAAGGGRKQSVSAVGGSASTAGQGRGGFGSAQQSSGSIRLPPQSASTSASASLVGTPTGGVPPLTLKFGAAGIGAGRGLGERTNSVSGTEVDEEDEGGEDEDDV